MRATGPRVVRASGGEVEAHQCSADESARHRRAALFATLDHAGVAKQQAKQAYQRYCRLRPDRSDKDRWQRVGQLAEGDCGVRGADACEDGAAHHRTPGSALLTHDSVIRREELREHRPVQPSSRLLGAVSIRAARQLLWHYCRRDRRYSDRVVAYQGSLLELVQSGHGCAANLAWRVPPLPGPC